MADRPSSRLDQPLPTRRRLIRRPSVFSEEAFGVLSERFARFMGTPTFLIWMSVFVVVWLAWNTFAPESVQFDPRSLNYTLLTLILSLQASYAAPLILLAQNRQDDRDRVALEQDRVQAERALADTEYLTREVAALRIALREVATRDYVRSELRELLDELRDELREETEPSDGRTQQAAAKAKAIADGGDAYPVGAREIASRLAADLPTKAETIKTIVHRVG